MDETEQTAYHECGHAYLAVHLGGRVRFLTIEPDRDDGPERFGEACVEWPTKLVRTKDFAYKLILVALAGPTAEMIYRGEPLHPGFIAEWRSDWQAAWAAGERLFPDERKCLALLEQATRELHDLLSNDAHWAAVAALADNLLAHDTLEREAIDDILAAWKP